MEGNDQSGLLLAMTILLLPTALWLVYLIRFKLLERKRRLELDQFQTERRTWERQRDQLESDFREYQSRMGYLRKYEAIESAELEAQRIVADAKDEAKELTRSASEKLANAEVFASAVAADAQERAHEIAGEAWIAKQNAEQYEATAAAMKNLIKGYGDEYLVPNSSILDSLAEEYDHKKAGVELKYLRARVRDMIKHGQAADCDYSETVRRRTAIEFVLDAFNGKVDTIMSKVKYDNYGVLLQQLKDAYRLVNHNGKAFRNARINERYFELVTEQLRVAVALQELKRQDKEEQRRIREEIREEERAQREYDRAVKKAEKEEKLLQNAMKIAEAKLAGAAVEERVKLESQIAKLNDQLREAEERGKRAISMAQQTKQGHVYVISNIGSFGEDVFKIGLTRRLDPFDRIKELGDASVPFGFDVHAMIHADDAPKLERDLHAAFSHYQINRINPRKEFFRLPLADIKEYVAAQELQTHWTMKAEAMEYRQSLQLAKGKSAKSQSVTPEIVV